MRALLPVLLVLAACDREKHDYGDPATGIEASLKRFESCEDVRGALVESFVEQLVYSRYGWRDYPEAGGDDGDNGGDDAPDDYSETNTQEEGVDEPDIVKTDGSFLYVVSSTRPELTIVDSWPAEETSVVGRLELEGYPYSSFLDGDTVVVFSYVYDERYGGWATGDSPSRMGYGTRLSFVDVSDRAAPTLVRAVDVEGWVPDARLIGHDAYVVVNSWINMPEGLYELAWDESLGLPVYEGDETDAEAEAERAAARAILTPLVEDALAELDVEELLPWVFSWDGAWDEGAPLSECTDMYHPDGVAQPGYLGILHVDLSQPEATTPVTTGLLANGWTVYASQESMYVSQASWWWSWGYGEDALDTHVHRFALDGGDTVYAASGEVPGWQYDQFQMDEEDGRLRMTTTEWDWWWGSSESEADEVYGNGVYVLEESAGVLSVVGALEDLAPGEMIYSTRFVGDTAYMVTFRQTDPLFAIDLSDPTSPTLLGELEIPGFSSYMHPLEGGYLLTVGMAGEEDGTLTGFAVKLFDVSDPTNPTQVQELVASSDDWSWSEALWDHHAFTFHNGVLTVPLYTYDWDDADETWTGFSGLWVIAVDPAGAGLSELGRVDHADLVAQSECVYYYDWYGDVEYTEPCPDDYWYAGVRRGVIMEDKLYSVSDYGVKVSELWEPDTTVATALFHPLE